MDKSSLLRQARAGSVLVDYLNEQHQPLDSKIMKYMTHSLKVQRKYLGFSHYETLESACVFAGALCNLQKYHEARKMAKEHLGNCKVLFAPEHSLRREFESLIERIDVEDAYYHGQQGR